MFDKTDDQYFQGKCAKNPLSAVPFADLLPDTDQSILLGLVTFTGHS